MNDGFETRADSPADGPSTRAVHAGLPPAVQGEPLLPGPVLAAPFHLRGPIDAAPYGYGRDHNPTWTHLERALGELDGGETVTFASGMAAVTAVVLPHLRPGDVLVAAGDGYPGIRKIAADHLEPRGVEVRLVPTDTDAIIAAAGGGNAGPDRVHGPDRGHAGPDRVHRPDRGRAGAARAATLIWIETPSNPRLDDCDVAAVVAAAPGALVAVDNTVATPLRRRPLDDGADFAMLSGTKSLSGHADLLLGAVSVRDPALAQELVDWRTHTGAIPGPFEAWLAHRSLATLGLRLERSEANARAIAEALAGHDDVSDVRWPGVGALVAFTLPSAEHAQRFLDGCRLVTEATSFGGVHTTAERRARWGTDAVPEGFIRFSAGCEDTKDLVADVLTALKR